MANLNPEERHTCQQDPVFSPLCFHVICAIVLGECTDNLLALHSLDLFVDKAAIVGNCQLELVTLNKLRLAGIIGWHRIILAIGIDHYLPVKDTFDYLARYLLAAIAWHDDLAIVANNTHQ